MPKCSATRGHKPSRRTRARENRWKTSSPARGAARCIRATTSDESTPPDRNAPSGTSLRSRRCTDDSRVARNCSTGLLLAPSSPRIRVRVPVRDEPPAAISIDRQVARRQLADAAKDGRGWGTYWYVRYWSSGGRIDLPRRAGNLQQTLQFAGEQQPLRLEAIDKRLLAQPIAGQHETAARRASQMAIANMPFKCEKHSRPTSS